MSTIWSDFVQTSRELYVSRELRFREDNKESWFPPLRVADGMKVLEVGCAGGALLHRIKGLNPTVRCVGVDRDTNHIAFAVEKTKELGLDCAFVAGDALALPFDEGSFDMTFSHTVIEHVETQPFLREQFRVLKPGGRVNVLSVRTGLNVAPENWKPESEAEKALLEKAWAGSEEFDNANKIGKFKMKEYEFPAALERAGFWNVDVRFAALASYAPDGADVSDELAVKQIEANRLFSLESVGKALRRNPKNLSEKEREKLIGLINARYDERLRKYWDGEKIWDISTSTVMFVSGVKPK